MRLIIPSCSKRADEALKCPSCDGFSIKNGKSKSGKQRYLCRSCNKYFLSYYSNQACNIGTNYEIIRFTKEGLGIRSIARVLEISATTLLKRLVLIAKNLRQPPIIIGKTYEVDEMKSFIGHKDKKIWIAYAMERSSKSVVSFKVGARTKKTLRVVIKTMLYSSAKKIYTDGWRGYRSGETWTISLNIEYVDGETTAFEDGDNTMNLDKLHDPSTERSSVFSQDKQETKFENGKWRVTGNYTAVNIAGNKGEMRGGLNGLNGYTIYHESMHFIGLSDRYETSSMETHQGYKGDVMESKGGYNFNQNHWNNWGRTILKRSDSKFILRENVDIQGTEKKIMLPENYPTMNGARKR